MESLYYNNNTFLSNREINYSPYKHPYFKNINWDDLRELKVEPPFIPDINDDTNLKCIGDNIIENKDDNINEKDSDFSDYKDEHIEYNKSQNSISFLLSPLKSNEDKDNLEGESNYEKAIFNESKLENLNKIKDTKENSSNMISFIQPEKKSKKLPFKTTIINEKKKDKKFLGNKKKLKKFKKNIPRKYRNDLIYDKNQISGINSCFGYANSLLKKYGIKGRFLRPKSISKKFTNYKNFLLLNQKKIGDILRSQRSVKNKKSDVNHNEILYNKVITNFPVIKNFFELKYITFFRKYYFIGERNISLKEYGSNEILTLDDCVITHPKKVQSFKDDEYAQTYENCVRNLYFKFQVKKS